MSFGTNLSGLIYVCLESLKERKEREIKNIWENNVWKFYKFDKNYKCKYSKNSLNFMYKKHEECYTKEQHNQILKSSDRENLKSRRGKKKDLLHKRKKDKGNWGVLIGNNLERR